MLWFLFLNKMKKNLLFTIVLFFPLFIFSQWSVPNPMEQFCAGGSTLTFPNVGNGPGAGNMGSVNCLQSTPNPSWYFLQVANSGDLSFNISQVANNGAPIDVDFALWGPFPSISQAIAIIQANPNNASLIDCSYSPSPQETATISGAQAGDVYVFLITNYSGQQGQISLTQTAGVGSTSCEFACGVSLGLDVITCDSSHTLYADFNIANADLTGVTYQWTYNGNPLPNTTATIVVNQDGEYSVTAQLENCIAPATASVQVTLNQDVPVINVDDMMGCIGESYNLNELTNQIVTQFSIEGFNVRYFDSLANANANQNPLPLNYQPVESKKIYVRITSNQFNDCFSVTSFTITVQQYPEITGIDGVYGLCPGENITISIPQNFDSYQWSDGSTSSTINITQAGNYSITVTKNNCSTTKTFTVTASEPATILDVLVTDFTMSENIIEVIVQGIGDYEYSLNGVEYQDSSIFTEVDSGSYMIHVRDKNGCGIVTQIKHVLMYPKFFTPNQDSINDYWHIKNSVTEPEMKVYIFDRYGKLIASFGGIDIGWDGTLNGKVLPSTDYWFLIKRQNGKQHRGHFSLVR